MGRAMAELRIGSGRYFERGIDSIVDAPEAPDALLLPDAQGLAPAALARLAAVEELLQVENLESLLEASVRPDVVERELLAPQRFRAAMDSVLAVFSRAADSRRLANPRLGKLLDRAARVLTEEIELRELLQMYRRALVQG
jgi:type III secretion protein X